MTGKTEGKEKEVAEDEMVRQHHRLNGHKLEQTVTTEAANGDWTRVEYVLSVSDVSKKISDEKISIGEGSVLNSIVKNSDENLILHIETRTPHPSGNGTMIQWIGEVDGIFTRIYYFTNNTGNVKTENLFNDMKISNISK